MTLVNPAAASGIAGPTTMTSAAGGDFLYNQALGSSSVNAYAVNPRRLIDADPVHASPRRRQPGGIAAT